MVDEKNLLLKQRAFLIQYNNLMLSDNFTLNYIFT